MDGIPVDVWKCLGEEGIDMLWDLMKGIYEQEQIPTEWRDSVIIPTRCKCFDPCYARATVVRARVLAAAFSDGSYLAHVNGAYLRHVTFCIVNVPYFSRNELSRLPWTPASPILAVM